MTNRLQSTVVTRGFVISLYCYPRLHAPNKAAYQTSSVFDLAAAYATGIILNHPFVDGNKRTGFLAAYVFLILNGWALTAPEAEAVDAVLALALKDMDETVFSKWLKDRAIRVPAIH